MAIYDAGTASLSADGTVTGVGTTWRQPLTLIRVGATMIFNTTPASIVTIAEIISDTEIRVFNDKGFTAPTGTQYSILAHDGITVQGLAQDVAETLRYYQSRETEVAAAVDAFNQFDAVTFQQNVTNVSNQSQQVSADAISVQNNKDSTDQALASAINQRDAAELAATNAEQSANDAQNFANSVAGAIIGSFQDGVTLNSKSQQIIDLRNGEAASYVWGGSLPKEVPAGSTPESTGGFSSTSWIPLSSKYPINDSRRWYEPSSTVDNTTSLQLFLTAMTDMKMTANIIGDVLTSSRVQCDCGVNASEANWYISPSFDSTGVGGAGAVLLVKDVDTVETSGNSFTTSGIGQISTVQLSGPQYRNSTVGIEGEGEENRAYYRNGTSYSNAIDLYVMDSSGNGGHQDTPALFKYTGTAKLIVRPLRPTRFIYGPRFIMSQPLTDSRVLRSCIKIQRNNTTLDGGYFDALSNGVLAESYVELAFVTQCTIKNVSMPSSQTSAATYTIQPIGTNRLTVQNCHAPNGWALVDGNFMRNTLVDDCSGATIGCHAMAWNFFVYRCSITPVMVSGRYQGGVGLTGGGSLVVEDLTYNYMGGTRELDHPVATRGDYGQAWEGDITINRLTVNMYNKPPSGQAVCMAYIQGALSGSIDLTRECYLGKKINISNVSVNVLNNAWTAEEVAINTAFFQTTGTQTVNYPSEYNVDGFTVYRSGLPTTSYTLDCRWPTLIVGDYVSQSTCKMVFKNVTWPSVSVGFIGPAASTDYRITPQLVIDESVGTLYVNQLAFNSGTVTIRKTRIGNVTLGNANGNGARYFIEDCDIAGKCGGSPSGKHTAYYYNCNIVTTSAVEIGSVAGICKGNSLVTGGSLTGGVTVSQWYDYVNPSKFRTS